jgi:hypothetical protein
MVDASGQVPDPFEAVFGGGDQPLRYTPQGTSSTEDQNDPFTGVFGNQTVDPTGSSATGSFTHTLVRGVAPAYAGIAAAGEGAELFGAAGFSVGGPVGAGIGAIAGGLAGMFGGSYLADKAQSYALSKAPDDWVEALGQDDRQQRLDQEQHPYASFLGGLAPYAVTMTPFGGGKKALEELLAKNPNATPLQRLMTNPAVSRVIGGAMIGGAELGQEAAEGNVDWNKVAIATGFGLVFNRPNEFGKTIKGAIPRALGRAPRGEPAAPGAPPPAEPAAAPPIVPRPAVPGVEEAPEEALAHYSLPTLIDADAYNVGGPGVDEYVSQGSRVRDGATQAEADQKLREQNATIGPMDAVDVEAVARAQDRRLFMQYDDLKAQREAFAARMRDLRAPDDEEIQAARESVDSLQAQHDALVAEAKGYTGGSEARKLRAQIREAQRAHDELVARKIADNAAELDAVTQQYQAADYAMRDLGPAVGEARRRAADSKGAETVAPTPIVIEPEDVASATTPEPLGTAPTAETTRTAVPPKSVADQKVSIAADVKRQFMAAGRPEAEAQDLGLLNAHYWARLASQLGGRFGTAEEMYRRESARVMGAASPSSPVPKEAASGAPTAAAPPTEAATAGATPKTKAKAAVKIAPADARAKVDSLGIYNLVDGLIHSGATPEEIAMVVNKKMTSSEIAALEPRGQREVKAPAAEKGETTREKAMRLEVSNLVDRMGVGGASAEDIHGIVGPKLSVEEIQQLLKEGPRAPSPPKAVLPKTPEPKAQVSRKVPKVRKPQTLRAFLKTHGGVRDQGGELRSADLHREYPGLINKNGMPLDRARELAAEAGYFSEHGAPEDALASTTVAHLVDALQEREPRHSERDAAELQDAKLKAAHAAHREEVRTWAKTIDHRLDEEGEPPIDAELRDYAAEMLADGRASSVDDAIEHAAIELYERDQERRHLEGAENAGDVGEYQGEHPFDVGDGERPGGEGAVGSALEARGTGGAAAHETESGPEGTRQTLIEGVKPVTDRDRIAAAAAKPLRGGNRDLQHEGLFGDGQRQQDMFASAPRRSLAERIQQAVIDAGGAPNQRVFIKDIRDRLPDVPRHELDAELKRLHETPDNGFHLSGTDNPHELTTGEGPARKEAGLPYKGEDMVAAWQTSALRQGKNEAKGEYIRGTLRGILRLFTGKADASTAIHELGHDFLERLRRYGTITEAPEQLRQDWATVRRALRLKKDGGVIPTRAHEQFARWFEQYLYEGTAPSKELAGVFARFKGWMAGIYKNVREILDRRSGQISITPEVRAVFDRMLAEAPERVTIADVRDPPRSPTDLHAEDAAKTEPRYAGPAADRVASERAEAAPPVEARNEIAATLEAQRPPTTEPTGETGRGDGRHGEVVGGGGQAGTEPERGGVGVEPSAQREGGAGASAEGAGVSAGSAGDGGGRRSVSGDAVRGHPLAPGPADVLTAPKRFVDKAGNIRLDNVNGAEDLKEAARELAATNGDFLEARDGVRSDAEVDKLQAVLGVDDIVRRKIGEAFNDRQLMAAQRIAAQAWREMHAAASVYKQTRSEADLLDYVLKQQRATMIQATYSGATAEAGRALRATRKIQEFWTPGADAAKAVAGGAPKPRPGDVIAEATGRALYQKAQEALLVAEYTDPQSAARFNTWTRKHSFGRMILEYWINGLLSGTATHTTYVIGNTILAMENGLVERPIAAALGAMRGGKGNVVRIGETGAYLRGARAGYFPAVQASMEALRTGLTGRLPGQDTIRTLPFQVEGAPPLAGALLNEQATAADARAAIYGASRGILDSLVSIGKILDAAPEGAPTASWQWSGQGANPDAQIRGGTLPIGQLIRLPSRVISAIHTFFRAMNYSMEKHALIYREALNDGLEKGLSHEEILANMTKMTNDTPDHIMDASTKGATDMTLMGPAGEFTRKLQTLTNWAPNIPGLGETPILKFIDPFVHIAANVIDQSIIQRTPAGLLSAQIRADLMSSDLAVRDMTRARMIAGTGMLLGFGALAARGLISGSGPSDRDKAAVWRLAGNQPHSIRIGDVWYATNRLGPMGMILGMSADLYDVARTASTGDLLGAAAYLHHAVVQNILDESFMRGPADLIQAVEDPGRYSEGYIRNFASSFLPMSVAMAQIDRASDPYSRQARTVIDALKAHTPGESETLFPKRDIWGEPIPNRDALLNPAVTAIYEQRMSRDPVNVALADMGIGIGQPDRSIRNVKLTDQQYDDFQRLAGRMMKMRLNVIVQSPDWRNWPVGVRADVIREVKDQSREAARGMIFMKWPSILAQATRMKTAKFQGLQ